jgi:hypothetical protein
MGQTDRWANKEIYKIEKENSLEYSHIPKMTFTLYHVGLHRTDMIRGQCCVLGYSCPKTIPGNTG